MFNVHGERNSAEFGNHSKGLKRLVRAIACRAVEKILFEMLIVVIRYDFLKSNHGPAYASRIQIDRQALWHVYKTQRNHKYQQ